MITNQSPFSTEQVITFKKARNALVLALKTLRALFHWRICSDEHNMRHKWMEEWRALPNKQSQLEKLDGLLSIDDVGDTLDAGKLALISLKRCLSHKYGNDKDSMIDAVHLYQNAVDQLERSNKGAEVMVGKAKRLQKMIRGANRGFKSINTLTNRKCFTEKNHQSKIEWDNFCSAAADANEKKKTAPRFSEIRDTDVLKSLALSNVPFGSQNKDLAKATLDDYSDEAIVACREKLEKKRKNVNCEPGSDEDEPPTKKTSFFMLKKYLL